MSTTANRPADAQSGAPAASGPVEPTADSRALHRPLRLRDVRIDGGPLGRWQDTNRAASIPLGIKQLEEAGNLHNLGLAAGEVTGDFRGPRFMDSDLYKQLEAAAWEAGRETPVSCTTSFAGPRNCSPGRSAPTVT